MKKIYVIGECVMDFIKDETAGDKDYRRGPGGCAVNVSAELARLIKARGVKKGGEITPYIIARTGRDAYGREIRERLEREGVNTLHLKTGAAPTSEVRMDICADGQRRCAGRKNGADAGLCAGDVKDITLNAGDAVCFTSGGFLTENGREAHMLILQKALKRGAAVCFDLNIREGLWEKERAREFLPPVIALSDVIKIKGYELEMLYGENSIGHLLEAAKKSPLLAVYTDGSSEKFYKRVEPDGEIVVETRFSERRGGGIGAGDEMFAGIVFGTVNGKSPYQARYVSTP